MDETMARQLWDVDYVRGGCVGLPPLHRGSDNMPGTYMTAYLVALVGFVAAVGTYSKPGASDVHQLYSGNFYFWTAVGYGLAGILHQVDASPDDPVLWWKVSYVSVTMGLASLLLLGIQILSRECTCTMDSLGCLNMLALLSTALAIVAIIVQQSITVPTLASLLVFLFMASVWLYCAGTRGGPMAGTKAVGALTMIAGLMVRVLLTRKCGEAGYATCWRECPLQGAPYLSHNAVSQTVFGVGLLILGFAMHASPDLSEVQCARSQDLYPLRAEEDSDFIGGAEPCHRACTLVNCAVM